MTTPPLPAPESRRLSWLAFASLACGLVSFAALLLTSIPAILLGHAALRRIEESGGSLTGEILAIAGIGAGYFMTAATVLIIALLALPG